MKRNKRGGLETIMVVLILILLVLACVPALKSIVNSNADAASSIKTEITNITK